ncbi:MAG: prepilin-type N-terminal cleavage/methylation domain-containing protein [Omnitrophica bacterium]|nr:prepilin-type N-terminal cleavage/methylation domain-containing protein [Candidatus Omnitrophota bacterium]
MKKKAINTIKRQTFSLLEIMVVLVIMGIVLSFAVPSYQGSIERSKGKIASLTLVSIYNAQKRHKLDNMGVYYICDPCSKQSIKLNLGINIDDKFFDYTITASVTGGFNATATRHDEGLCANEQMFVTEIRGRIGQTCDFW